MKLKHAKYPILALAAVIAALMSLAVAARAARAAAEPQPAAEAAAVRTQTAQPAPVRIGYTLVEPESELEEETPKEAFPEEASPEPEPEPQPEAPAEEDAEAPSGPAVPDDLELLDTFLATAYCQTGTTATGTYTTVNRTLAVNPGIIPYGTHVWLYLDDGTLVGDYYAEDTGSNMMAHPYVIDIYMGTDYDTCIAWGVQHVRVYVEKDAEN